MVLRKQAPYDAACGDFDIEHVIKNASVTEKISLLSGMFTRR